MKNSQDTSRRDFLKVSAGTVLATGALATGVHAAGSDEIRVGVIGCGGRGSGAAENVLHSAKGVKVIALGDAFEDRAKGLSRRLSEFASDDKKCKELGNGVDLNGRVFVGLDAYKKVIDQPDVNYIILATPPGFRPLHIQAAIAAKKHLFTEKPVGVDAPGIRKVLEAHKEAQNQKLGVAAGTQRRHQASYLETMKQIHQGEIGDIMGGRCAWNQGILWSVKRRKEWSDLQAQMRNWYNYTWLCGDHIVEQHVHNIDVINWAIRAHPVRCVGMGFRTRTNPEFGHIYDFFSVDFEYPNGVHVISQCRQISGCDQDVSEFVRGTKGTSQLDKSQINGKVIFRGPGRRAGGQDPYVQEHTDLIESIRKGDPLNELKNVAESTLTAIMGRQSAYTGKPLTWDQMLNSKEDLTPANLAWDMTLPEPPVAVPGKTKFI